jgi:hypothetical protein
MTLVAISSLHYVAELIKAQDEDPDTPIDLADVIASLPNFRDDVKSVTHSSALDPVSITHLNLALERLFRAREAAISASRPLLAPTETAARLRELFKLLELAGVSLHAAREPLADTDRAMVPGGKLPYDYYFMYFRGTRSLAPTRRSHSVLVSSYGIPALVERLETPLTLRASIRRLTPRCSGQHPGVRRALPLNSISVRRHRVSTSRIGLVPLESGGERLVACLERRTPWDS